MQLFAGHRVRFVRQGLSQDFLLFVWQRQMSSRFWVCRRKVHEILPNQFVQLQVIIDGFVFQVDRLYWKCFYSSTQPIIQRWNDKTYEIGTWVALGLTLAIVGLMLLTCLVKRCKRIQCKLVWVYSQLNIENSLAFVNLKAFSSSTGTFKLHKWVL